MIGWIIEILVTMLNNYSSEIKAVLIEPPQAVNTEYLEGKKKKEGKKPSEIGQPVLTVSSDLGKFWLC